MKLNPFSVPRLTRPLEARLLHGPAGHRLREQLAQHLPLTCHARDRMGRSQRCITEELVRVVLRYGRAIDVARGVRLALAGVARPSTVSTGHWSAASALVVPVDEFGFIPTVFRRGRR